MIGEDEIQEMIALRKKAIEGKRKTVEGSIQSIIDFYEFMSYDNACGEKISSHDASFNLQESLREHLRDIERLESEIKTLRQLETSEENG